MLINQVDQKKLSIIITTSPIKSNPDTVVIDEAIQSIFLQPTLNNVHIFVMCDGTKMSNTKENNWKGGIVNKQTLQNYEIFKQRIKEKYGKNSEKFTIIERENRCGFAQNIHYCMKYHAVTPWVMIFQHDHAFEKQIDFQLVVEVMQKHKPLINYITFMNKSYKTIPHKLLLQKNMHDHLNELVYKKPADKVIDTNKFILDILKQNKEKFNLTLMPLYFWYDKVHIASRQYYLDVIFRENGYYDKILGKHLKTKNFVEDTFGHYMKRKIEADPSQLLKLGAYILWDEESAFYHQGGRTFMTKEQVKQYEGRQSKKKKIQHEEIEVQMGDFPI